MRHSCRVVVSLSHGFSGVPEPATAAANGECSDLIQADEFDDRLQFYG